MGKKVKKRKSFNRKPPSDNFEKGNRRLNFGAELLKTTLRPTFPDYAAAFLKLQLIQRAIYIAELTDNAAIRTSHFFFKYIYLYISL